MQGKKPSSTKEEIMRKMRNYFQTNAQLEKWLHTPSRYFYAYDKGNLSPQEMMDAGREKELLTFIKIHLGEN